MQIITKGLIGLQDIAVGTSTFTRATSSGGTIVLSQVNAANLGFGYPATGYFVPTGTVNGVNTVFTLPGTPGLLLLFKNGLLQNPGVGNDYTITGGTITFTYAPATGSTLLAVF